MINGVKAMKTLEKGQDKIQKICTALREETLEPAHKEAQRIIDAARLEAEQIVIAAKKSADQLHQEAKASIEQERNVFQSSLQLGAKQALEALRQSLEKNFFNTQLSSLLDKNAADPQLVATLINAIALAVQKEGLNADLSLIIPKSIEPRRINELLLQDAVKGLKDGGIINGTFAAGAQVKIKGKNLTIDISDAALKELLSGYIVRKDFRKMLFDAPGAN